MSETILTDGEVVLVRWKDITTEGLARVDAAVRDATAFGHVIFVGLVGNESALPSEAVRQRMKSDLDEMAKTCQSVSLVLDGSGLRFSAMRSAAAAMFLIKGTRQMKMFATLNECLLDRVPDRAESLLTKAKAIGVINL